jgi:outer membrane protein assembly factor BamB
MRKLLTTSLVRISRCILTISLLLAASAWAENPGEWPNWRGPNGNGSIETGKYPVKWDATNVLWKARLPGKGTSTPIVRQERVYLTGPSDGQDAVMAFDFSGQPLWQTKLGPESQPKHRTLASSGNASPVTDGRGIFVYFKSGSFAALEFDGKVRWQTNLAERFGREQLFWDQGSSPIVTEKHVVMARIHSGESWLAGFDKATGELRWQQARNYKAPSENDNGYATPVTFQHAGQNGAAALGSGPLDRTRRR